MKIGLFVDGSFLPSREGATQRIYLLAKYLQKMGIDIIVFHCYRGWSNIEIIKKEKFKTYFLSHDEYYKDANYLSRIIINEGIDIIQMCDASLILSQGVKIKSLTQVKIVWEVHEVVSNLMIKLEQDDDISNIKEMEYCENKI